MFINIYGTVLCSAQRELKNTAGKYAGQSSIYIGLMGMEDGTA